MKELTFHYLLPMRKESQGSEQRRRRRFPLGRASARIMPIFSFRCAEWPVFRPGIWPECSSERGQAMRG